MTRTSHSEGVSTAKAGKANFSHVKQLTLLTKNSLFGAGASYLLTLSIASYLGPTDFGLYSYAMILGSVAGLIVSFATENTAPVLLAQVEDEYAVFNSVLSVRLVFLALISLSFPWLLYSQPIVGLGVIAITTSSLNLGFLYEITQRNLQFSYIYLVERLSYVSMVFVLIFLDAASVGYIFILMFLFRIGSYFWQIKLNLPFFQKFRLVTFDQLKLIISENFYLVCISLTTFAYGGFSRLILERNYGLAELGVYSAGWQITLAVTIFQAQVDRIWRVRLSSSLHDRNPNSVFSHITDYLVFSTLPVVALALAVYLLSPQIVNLLFGEEYQPLVGLMPVFCLYFPVINLDGLARMLWVGGGSRLEYLIITASVSAFLICALLLFSSQFTLGGFALLVIVAHASSVVLLLVRFSSKYVRPMRLGH